MFRCEVVLFRQRTAEYANIVSLNPYQCDSTLVQMRVTGPYAERHADTAVLPPPEMVLLISTSTH
jgi:hypothetical protein